jgi:hypothetical protein
MNSTASVPWEDVIAFLERLAALARSGVSLGSLDDGKLSAKTIEELQARVAVRAGRHEPIDTILANDPNWGPDLHQAFMAWRESGRWSGSFQPLVSAGRWRTGIGSRFALAIGTIAIAWILSVAYLLWLVPHLTANLRGMYDVSDLTPGPVYRQLAWIDAHWNEVAWGLTLVSVAVLIASAWQLGRARFRWLPGRAKVVRWLEQSEMLRGAFASPTSNALGGAPAQVAGLDRIDAPLASPLMEWAVRDSATSSENPIGMPLVSRLFRRQATQTRVRKQVWIPQLIGILATGLVVLALGWLVFGPMSELLMALCSPVGVSS